eukprot:CAMPEP_0180797756 /NCGR_PEP_ID=MMETSP1038_2-20121128/57557_1 /TAXON_ID=632150 /ORGANISM="Azadinium spinosum, Strain 3D9" /LENGTH=59 /DNA_ID=CAMNT_0022837073 /DNA_START=16 /DNA_END=192 /DNA_ORIENTATION=-
MTMMIVHLADGTDWASKLDEMQGFQRLFAKDGDQEGGPDEDTRNLRLAFLQRAGFPAKP